MIEVGNLGSVQGGVKDEFWSLKELALTSFVRFRSVLQMSRWRSFFTSSTSV